MKTRLAPLLLAVTQAFAAPLPPLQVQPGGHHFQAGGKPFTWMGDTAWMLLHDASRAEASYYLATRARQGFNVIQTVALAEFDGLRRPSRLGLLPFKNLDPDQPNEAYFDRIVEVVDEAATRGLYVALLPSWGDKLEGAWGGGPNVFPLAEPAKAQRYAAYLAKKLQGRSNLVWMLGGDRPPVIDASSPEWVKGYLKREKNLDAVDWRPIWRAFAAGIREVAGPQALIGYHPEGGLDGTAPLLHGEPWLAMNGLQSGHGAGHDVPLWEAVERDFARRPAKPILDLEPNYEDCPVSPWPSWNPALGYFRDLDVRKQVYRGLFAGSAGATYGHHSVWQFTGERNEPIIFPERDWRSALGRPGGRQIGFARWLMDSRPSFQRVPLQGLLKNPWPQPACHARATGDLAGGFLMVYLPCESQPFELDLSGFAGRTLQAWWFDPRVGMALPAPAPKAEAGVVLTTPGYGPDWVLVIDDATRRFPLPGLAP